MHRSPSEGMKSSSHPDLTSSAHKRKIGPGTQADDEFSHFQSEMLDLMTKMKEDQDKKFNVIAGALEEVKSQNRTILKTQDNLEKIYEHSTALHAETKITLDKISTEHKEALLKISFLEEQLEEVQRNQRAKCMEIINIPESVGEDLKDLISKLHRSLGVDYKSDSISSVHRNKNSRGKPVIVEYHSQYLRNEVLKASKYFNKTNRLSKLSTSTLGFMTKMEPIFINELLTPKARQLYYQARLQVKSEALMYCWINNGRVFVKKSEGDPAIHIKSVLQLMKLHEGLRPMST